jgi:hypothetical protein
MQDTIITLLSLFLFPVFTGLALFILTIFTTRNVEIAIEEGFKLTKVMWAVILFGVLISVLFKF